MAFVIHITGPAGAGKTLLARCIDRAHPTTARAILEWGGKLTPADIKAIDAAKSEAFDLAVFVGDWPAERLEADMVINVRRETSPEGRRYSSRPPGMESDANSALPGGKSPSPATPDPTHGNAARCSKGTKQQDFFGLRKQFRAARELLSRASADISVFPSLRLLTKSEPSTQP